MMKRLLALIWKLLKYILLFFWTCIVIHWNALILAF